MFAGPATRLAGSGVNLAGGLTLIRHATRPDAAIKPERDRLPCPVGPDQNASNAYGAPMRQFAEKLCVSEQGVLLNTAFDY